MPRFPVLNADLLGVYKIEHANELLKINQISGNKVRNIIGPTTNNEIFSSNADFKCT